MEKLAELRKQFDDLGIDGLMITSRSNRHYMTGFTGTAGTVLISYNEAIFITDFRYVEQAADQAVGYSVVENRDAATEVSHQLEKMGITKLGFEQDHLTYKVFNQFNKKMKQGVEMVPVSEAIERLRMIKTEEEINILKSAANIADQAFAHIVDFIQPGMTEMDVNHELEYYMRKQGAASSSFDLIVASGDRSAMPHGVASKKVIKKGDMLTLDFGAYYEGYCSDMTRSIAIGEPTDKLKNIYEVVLEALNRGVDAIKAGVSCRAVDTVVRDFIAEKGYGEKFGHGTGHAIGLEIHEGPFFSQKSDDSLSDGMVMTVEPGIYIPGIGGVRIEDDVLVTERGHELLTHSPKELIVL